MLQPESQNFDVFDKLEYCEFMNLQFGCHVLSMM